MTSRQLRFYDWLKSLWSGVRIHISTYVENKNLLSTCRYFQLAYFVSHNRATIKFRCLVANRMCVVLYCIMNIEHIQFGFDHQFKFHYKVKYDYFDPYCSSRSCVQQRMWNLDAGRTKLFQILPTTIDDLAGRQNKMSVSKRRPHQRRFI